MHVLGKNQNFASNEWDPRVFNGGQVMLAEMFGECKLASYFIRISGEDVLMFDGSRSDGFIANDCFFSEVSSYFLIYIRLQAHPS